jgi:hypothetical protein
MKYVRTFIFGERAVGEKLAPPTVTTTYPDNRPDDFNDWIAQTFNQLRSKRKVAMKKKVARLNKES